MYIQGQHLLELLRSNTKPIQFRAGHHMVRMLTPAETLRKAETGLYIGVGSPRRVRILRLAEECGHIRPLAPSCFTRRVRNQAGLIIAARQIVEHRDACK